MKDKIKELRYEVLHLQNMGEISIKAESKLLHKLNGVEEQLRIGSVSQQRELLNALADDFNDSTDTYVGQTRIEEVLKVFNCG